jgi:hypothetical protein
MDAISLVFLVCGIGATLLLAFVLIREALSAEKNPTDRAVLPPAGIEAAAKADSLRRPRPVEVKSASGLTPIAGQKIQKEQPARERDHVRS